jgi:hypothetical protein
MGRKDPKSREEDLVIQELDNEVLIYDIRENRAFCLNETSAAVWKACDGNRDRLAIASYVSEKLGSPVNDDLVWLALDQLAKESLITSDSPVEQRFDGMSRREVIRKVGIGSMIALPIVASIVAPRAIHAQTCLANGSPVGTATLPGNCPANSPAARDAACDAQQGSLCCSGNAAATGSCSGNPAVFPCVCTA